MKSVDAYRQKQRIDSLLERAQQLNQDPETQAHWARYLCVIMSGFIENAVREIFGQYAHVRAQPSVARYVARSLESFQNPNMEKIVQVAQRFDDSWPSKILQSANDGGKEAVDSIVSQRHQIAHGRDTSLSLGTLTEYYKKAIRVLEYLESLCGI